jgi:hypothetical protein
MLKQIAVITVSGGYTNGEANMPMAPRNSSNPRIRIGTGYPLKASGSLFHIFFTGADNFLYAPNANQIARRI